MTSSKLTQVCREIIELGEKAQKSRWHCIGITNVQTMNTGEELQNLKAHNICDYSTAATQHAERLAKACLIMQEALEKVTAHRDYRELRLWAKQALEKVEGLLK